MILSRRNFLKSSAATLATLPLLSMPEIKVYHIGLQLYSVRDDMNRDPVGTLKKIAAMGYKEVEHASYESRKFYGFGVSEFKGILEDLGLKMPTSHVVFQKEDWLEGRNDVSDAWKATIEDAVAVGQEYLFCPWFAWDIKQSNEMKKGVEAYNRCGEISRAAGLRYGFHNHTVEFETSYEGKLVYEYMLSNWDLAYVCQQMDLCNLAIAGADPMDWLRRYPHHFESLHVKDRLAGQEASTLLGEGTLNLEEILAFAKKHTPVKYWIIEQESYGQKTPLEAVAYDLNKFKSYGFGGGSTSIGGLR